MLSNGKEQEIVINYDIETVYSAMIRALQVGDRFKIKNSNKIAHSISVSTGMSLFSYGGLLTITMQQLGDQQTRILFSVRSKLGTEILAGSRNQKDIDILIDEMTNRLPHN